MKNKSKLKKMYVKYVIKSSILYYFFLLFGVALFLFLSLNLRLDVRESFNGTIEEQKIIIYGEHAPICNVIHIYENRNDAIYAVVVDEVVFQNNNTVLKLNDNENLVFVGDVQVELTVRQQTLFERIFRRAGKS